LSTFKSGLKSSYEYTKAFLKWIIIAVLVGIIGGAVGSVFHISIDMVTDFRIENSFVIYLLPVGGIVIALIYHIFKSQGRIDTNRVLEAVREDEKIPLIMAPVIFISTVITHLLGGSAGREGAALQLGGSIGYNMGRVFGLGKRDMRIIVMSGMSAVFAALFGTPLTAAFFAIEVVSVGVMHYGAFVPAVFSALVASQIAKVFGLHPVHFNGVPFPEISIGVMAKVAILAVLCAIVSIIFCFAIDKCEHYGERFLKNRYLRTVVGAGLIVLLTVLVQCHDYNGAGMDIITNAIYGSAKYEAFILKMLFTVITIAAGFRGGEIVPTFFIGSTFGCVMGYALGLNPGFAAAIGFVALFCGVVNCPVASVILALEVFGGEAILIFAAAVGISYMMSGYYGLYKSQKIVYSKLDEHYIDVNTK